MGRTLRSFNEMRFRSPAPSTGYIPRPRVSALLDAAARTPTVLVTGPAGTGKTLAVADWVRRPGADITTAWLSLDRADSQTPRLWSSLLSALTVAVAGTVDLPAAPRNPDPGFLMEAIRAVGGRLRIVFDDLQRVEEGDSLAWLEDLMNWPPAGLQLILVGRHEPPILLQKLRLEGKLSDVRAIGLAFDEDEAALLLRDSGIELERDELARMTRSAGGWAAALRLAVLSLEVGADRGLILDTFAGPGFNVSQYLWDEVLGLLPAEFGEFLLCTSVSERLCAPLATAISLNPDADRILEALAEEQLLSHEVSDTGWYQMHPLLARVLKTRLLTTRPDLGHRSHRGAALWFKDNGAPIQALEHAIAAADPDLIGSMALSTGLTTRPGPDRERFVEQLTRIPDSAAGHPELAVARAIAAFDEHAHTNPRLAIEWGEVSLAALPEPRRGAAESVLLLLRTRLAYREHDGPSVLEHARAGRRLLERLTHEDVQGWELLRRTALGAEGIGELWAGDPARAVELLSFALAHPTLAPSAPEPSVSGSGMLAVAAALRGTTKLAAAETDRLLLPEAGICRRIHLQWPWLARALTELESAAFEASLHAQREAVDAAGERLDPFVEIALKISSGRRLTHLGELVAANRALLEAEELLHRRPGLLALRPSLVAARVDLWLARGEAGRCVAHLAQHPFDDQVGATSLVTTARARVLLATGRADLVRETVSELCDGVGVVPVEAWLAIAAAEDQLRRDGRAVEALDRALGLAEDDSVRLPLYKPTHRMVSALVRHLEVVGTHRDLIEWSLDTGSGRDTRSQGPISLTEREGAVLLYLQTMSSNAEIARSLCVSENTVKQHLKSIYRKLSVSSRRDAVRVARASGLLEITTVG